MVTFEVSVHSRSMVKTCAYYSIQLVQPNILLDADKNVQIADFGLTTYADSQSKALMSTRAGNPMWMAPELIAQRQNQSVRPTYASDLYSFAMVCFEVSSVNPAIRLHVLTPSTSYTRCKHHGD